MALPSPGTNLERLSDRLKRIKVDADRTKKTLEDARGLMSATRGDLNRRQQAGGEGG